MIAAKIRPDRRPWEPAERVEKFDWPLANAAESFLRDRIEAFLTRNSFARRLAQRMREETATDFFEWVDHLCLHAEDEQPLRQAGFARATQSETANGETVYEHPRATLPRVLLRPNGPPGQDV